SKQPGEEGFYLEQHRAYRSEHDVFDDYSEEERDRRFGRPPATVWENMTAFWTYPQKTEVLTAGGVFTQEIIGAFVEGAINRWKTELLNRIIPANFQVVVASQCLHTNGTANDYDHYLWGHINGLRYYLAKDFVDNKCLFTRIGEAVGSGDYRLASELQKEMSACVEELKRAYQEYRRNSLDGEYHSTGLN
ncbi:MAG: glutamine synthetase, partial [Negativicutes bacterium]|nr:glutamine synthetase [Negativicutes bacterium]